jgi:hypothetical protein
MSSAPSPDSTSKYGVWNVTLTLGAIAVSSALLFTALSAFWKNQRDVITFAAAAVVAASAIVHYSK